MGTYNSTVLYCIRFNSGSSLAKFILLQVQQQFRKKLDILWIIFSLFLSNISKFVLQFKCDICHRKYKSPDILRHHVRIVHKNLPRAQSEICQKKSSLNSHIARRREKVQDEQESARNLSKLSQMKNNNVPFYQNYDNYFENELHDASLRKQERIL